WPDAGDGGNVCLLRRVGISRALSLRRETTWTAATLPSGADDVPRLVALRILHHHHQRLHAASSRTPSRTPRIARDCRFVELPAQSLGTLAVCPHDDRGGDYRRIRRLRGRRLLDIDGHPSGAGPDFPQGGSLGRFNRFGAAALPDGR